MAYLENSVGFESMVWFNDRSGKKFVCYLNDTKNIDHFEQLPGEVQEKCINVNNLIGTARW